MNGLREPANSQEAARKIRATLVELLSVATLGGLDETAQYLEKAIVEADRVAGAEGGTAFQLHDKRHT